MSKYHFVIDNKDGDKILEYDTDAEPPHVGEFFQPMVITNDKDENTYRVTKIFHVPESSLKTIVHIEVVVA